MNADEYLRRALTSNERQTANHALLLAAERFDEDAKASREAGQARLAEQFERQARESRELAERME
jgi:hypothetical protein